jgi:5'-nucleotidase
MARVIALNSNLEPVMAGNLKRPRVFVDLDGVTVDFDGFMQKHGIDPETVKGMEGAYLNMRPIPGAIDGIREIMRMGFDVFIATKPPTGIAHAYADKAQWVFDHLPELAKKLIVTSEKGLLGDGNDYLIDDRPHKAKCEDFAGTLLVFGKVTTWNDVLRFMRAECAHLKSRGSL